MDASKEMVNITQKKRNRDILIYEGITGITKRDTLPNTALPLEKEAAAMYFKKLREFFKTSLAARCINIHQDVYGGK